MDDILPAKTAKFTSLKNLYVYGSYNIGKSGKSLSLLPQKYWKPKNILLYGPLDITWIFTNG